jgi:aryl-alcohol dehydrogenase-like predicted oxidoreductase
VALETRKLGGTGFDVTVLAYGALELRGRPRGRDVSDEEAGQLLNTVLDSGINLIDVAPEYGRGEDLIGRHLAARRDEFFLSSKCGCPLELDPPSPWRHDYSPTHVRACVERSLTRLRTDHLDLVQLHASPSRDVLEREGTIGELVKLRDEGKIRFIGMSGTLPHLRDQAAMGVFDIFQIPYSGLQREHEALISEIADLGSGTMIRGALARGVPVFAKDWRLPDNPTSSALGIQRLVDRWLKADIDDLLEGATPIGFMLRFALSHPGLCTALVGTASLDELRANVATAARGPLPSDVYAEAKERFTRAEPAPADS